jgi:hypothetical protein
MLKGVDQNRTDMLTEPAMVTAAPEFCNRTFTGKRDFYSVSACAVVQNTCGDQVWFLIIFKD